MVPAVTAFIAVQVAGVQTLPNAHLALRRFASDLIPWRLRGRGRRPPKPLAGSLLAEAIMTRIAYLGKHPILITNFPATRYNVILGTSVNSDFLEV